MALVFIVFRRRRQSDYSCACAGLLWFELVLNPKETAPKLSYHFVEMWDNRENERGGACEIEKMELDFYYIDTKCFTKF